MVKTKRIVGIAIAILTLATTLATIFGAGPDFLPNNNARELVRIGGWSSFALAIGLAAWAVIKMGQDKWNGEKISRGKFQRKSCTPADIDLISIIAEEEFEGAATTRAETRAIHQMDPSAFMVLVDGNGQIAGYRCVLCLTGKGVRALKDGHFSVKNLTRDLIHTGSKKSYRNIYIGAVWGRNPHCKGLICGSVDELIMAKAPTAVFARAATEDGLRLLKSQNFKPLGGAGALDSYFVKYGQST